MKAISKSAFRKLYGLTWEAYWYPYIIRLAEHHAETGGDLDSIKDLDWGATDLNIYFSEREAFKLDLFSGITTNESLSNRQRRDALTDLIDTFLRENSGDSSTTLWGKFKKMCLEAQDVYFAAGLNENDELIFDELVRDKPMKKAAFIARVRRSREKR